MRPVVPQVVRTDFLETCLRGHAITAFTRLPDAGFAAVANATSSPGAGSPPTAQSSLRTHLVEAPELLRTQIWKLGVRHPVRSLCIDVAVEAHWLG